MKTIYCCSLLVSLFLLIACGSTPTAAPIEEAPVTNTAPQATEHNTEEEEEETTTIPGEPAPLKATDQ
ncbi:MAG: hypothetical protein ACRBFS_10710 [Aureispira sp.]